MDENEHTMLKEKFHVLSYGEEQSLTSAERELYYDELREFVLRRKLTNTTVGALRFAPKCKGLTNFLAKILLPLMTSRKTTCICDGLENIPTRAAIFAYTHQGILDNFVWLPQVRQHCLILHGQEVNKFLLLFQHLIGLVYVRKEDRLNNANAKLDMIRLLLEGHSITYFPEGTWNLSPNKLHLPMRFGFLDVARKAGVPVVPAVLEYTYDTSTTTEKITKIHISFGKPIYVQKEDDLQEKLAVYSEVISTMRWDAFSEKGLFKRKDLSPLEYSNYLQGEYKNLRFGKLDIDKERRNIFGAQDEFHQFFPINDVVE